MLQCICLIPKAGKTLMFNIWCCSVFPLKSGTKVPTISITLSITLQILTKALRHERAITGIWIGNKEIKLYLLKKMWLCFCIIQKNPWKNETIREFSKVTGYKMRMWKKSIYICMCYVYVHTYLYVQIYTRIQKPIYKWR